MQYSFLYTSVYWLQMTPWHTKIITYFMKIFLHYLLWSPVQGYNYVILSERQKEINFWNINWNEVIWEQI
jgi:hypothetical protein